MKNRLEIAKTLLSDDGVIFIQIDDEQQAYLKVLCDEVFCESNFVNCIAVKMSEPSGVKMSHSKKRYPKLKEYLLFYKKSDAFKGFVKIDKYEDKLWDEENNIFLENFSKNDRDILKNLEEKEINSKDDVDIAIKCLKNAKKISLSQKIKSLGITNCQEIQDWKYKNSYRIVKTAGSTSLANLVKGINHMPKQEISAGLSKENILFYYITDFNRETKQPRLQVIFADSNLHKNPCDFWQDIKTTGAIAEEGAVKLNNGKKPESLLKRIIDMTTEKEDIVLDFFLGTGSTCAVAHKMGRQYIGIEQLDYGKNDSVVRLQNVINGDQTGISKTVNWQGGGSFVYCELAKYNENYIDLIKKAKTTKELKEIWDEMQEKAFLSYKVDIKTINENISDFEKFTIEEQKRFLFEVLDKNMLYVNYCDIDDETYKISEYDKKMNRDFYRK